MAELMTETFNNKLSREGELLSSISHEVPKGILEAVDDAWQHKGRTAFEIGAGVAGGTLFTLISRNPNQAIKTATQWLGYSFAGFAAVDLGSRVYVPMHDVWQNPQNLEDDKKLLGRNLGDAIFNYGLAVAGGGAGAAFGERYLESTKFGELLSGQKVTHFDGGSFPEQEIAAKFKTQGFLESRAGSSLNQSESPNPKMQYTMRQFRDGSSLINSSDGLTVLRSASGPELWIKSKQNWWSLKPELEILPKSPFSAKGSQLLRPGATAKFLAEAPPEYSSSKVSVDLGSFTNRFYPWEKGSEGGLGAVASQWALERAGDIGTAILQHKLLLKWPGTDDTEKAKSDR